MQCFNYPYLHLSNDSVETCAQHLPHRRNCRVAIKTVRYFRLSDFITSKPLHESLVRSNSMPVSKRSMAAPGIASAVCSFDNACILFALAATYYVRQAILLLVLLWLLIYRRQPEHAEHALLCLYIRFGSTSRAITANSFPSASMSANLAAQRLAVDC